MVGFVYNNKAVKIKHRGVEQLVARRAHNPKVVGSSPAPATNIANRKRYRFGKPGNHNGFGVFSHHFSSCNSKDIISPKKSPRRT